jgi:GR25 family glycosyltransferase involved in LPS biosynthesis
MIILAVSIIYFYANRNTMDVPVYIINGKDYTDRYNRTKGLLKKMHFSNYKVWDAVFPKNKKFISNNKEHECSLKIGALGCSKSHRTLWKHIYQNHKEDEWIIIFEDDITMPKNLKPQDVTKLMKHYMENGTKEKVDIIYFGYCWVYLCTHAYAVTPKGAKLLYDNTYDCIVDKPQTIDVQMSTLRKKNIVKVLRTDEYEKDDNSWAEGLFHQMKGDSIIQSHK